MSTLYNQNLPPLPIIPASTFNYFKSLPPELRIMVWKHAAVPRTIKVVTVGIRRIHNAKPANRETPIIMKVCRESRQVGKRIYSRCFRRTFYGDWIWFSWNFDTLYFPYEGAFIDFVRGHYYDRNFPIPPIPRDLLKLQSRLSHLAINGRGTYFEALYACLGNFERLKTVEIQKITIHRVESVNKDQMDMREANLLLEWSKHASYDALGLPALTWMEAIKTTMKERQKREAPWVFARRRSLVENWEM